MRYVILRDDDTNALTPIDCLERLYRPFLDRRLPVNLAVIPEVRTDVRQADGRREGFLGPRNGATPPYAPIGGNGRLTDYLRSDPGWHVVQHGCHHDYLEFDSRSCADLRYRIERGARRLLEAGFPSCPAFVAPYDKLSREAYSEAARQFGVISTGWFELRRLPWAWRARCLFAKLRRQPHWRAAGTIFLSHPGCLLSRMRPFERMLAAVRSAVERQPLTVLVTHWWEYFPNHAADERFIGILHATAEFLAAQPDLRVITFEDLAEGRVRLPGRSPHHGSSA